MRSNREKVEQYLEFIDTDAVGYLAKDLRTKHEWSLGFIAFAIENLHHLPNLRDSVRELAAVPFGRNRELAKYYNLRTEFMAMRFVADVLSLSIAEVESPTHKIISPTSDGQKSCDIRATNGENDYYFDAKDFSAEILSLEPLRSQPNAHTFEPADPRRLRRWIEQKAKETAKKGANFCIGRIPSMGLPDAPVFTSSWVHELFGPHKRTGLRECRVETRKAFPTFFNGVYLIHESDYLLLRLESHRD